MRSSEPALKNLTSKLKDPSPADCFKYLVLFKGEDNNLSKVQKKTWSKNVKKIIWELALWLFSSMELVLLVLMTLRFWKMALKGDDQL